MLLSLPLGGVGGGLLVSCQDTDSISNPLEQNGDIINVGGVSMTDELEVSSRAGESAVTDSLNKDAAERQEWLIAPLKEGLDITYGKVGSESATNKVAILKLQSEVGTNNTDIHELAGPTGNQYAVDKDTKWAIYTFRYRVTEGEGDDAYWHGNGAHYFEGQYVPQALRYGSGTSDASSTEETVNTTSAPGLHSNQTDKKSGSIATGNYTLLAQYLGMPAHTRLSATVARVKLPFRHRLCRVLAYVLIDPGLGTGVTLEGYKKTQEEQTSGMDDPETTEMHFSNVEVLAGVEDKKPGENDNGHHTLTPKWKTARKVIPHFNGEVGSKDKNGNVLDDDFIVFMNIDNDTYTYPTDATWSAKKKAYDDALAKTTDGNDAEAAEKACKYRKINYGKVPVYDIIARPTYTTLDNVMYDEAGVKNADGTENEAKMAEYLAKSNKIDFDLTLSNGLQYAKSFTFDLDANYQTVVYLRISPESVDYNSSGAEVWVNTATQDDWYGIDNENGNNLSKAGSSWQRAFTCGTTVEGDKVTDGGYYNESTTGEDGTAGQYLTTATWKKYFAEAYEGGKHHGDYFILNSDITIDASELPKNFVFTGHLDAQDHIITFTGGNSDVYEVTTNYDQYPTTKLYTESDGSYHEYTLPDLYINNEVAQAKGDYIKTNTLSDDTSIDKGEDMMIKQNVTLAGVMDNTETYYVKNADDSYSLFTRPTTLYTHRKGASALFCGLDGIYTTSQEKAQNPYAAGVKWEANVHKEKNNKGTETWVPYKGGSSGWRAEVINTKVKGSMFEDDAVITGNVQNCFEGSSASSKVANRTPEYPKYK